MNCTVFFFVALLNHRHYKHDENDNRENECHIGANPTGEANAFFTAVDFFFKVLPSPAVTTGAKEHVHQSTNGEEQVGDDEVLQIHKGFSKHGYVAPNVRTEYAGE